MTPALHKTAYNRAKTARAGAFAQLAGGTPNSGRDQSASYAAVKGEPEATCRAPCATSRLACFWL